MTFNAITPMLGRLTAGWRRLAASGLLRRLAFSRNGNVAIIAAFGMIPVALAAGMGVDYAIQKRGQDQLDGIADATALIATTPAMMTQTSTYAQSAAQTYWNNQSGGVFNVNHPVTGTVNVTDTVNGNVVTRKAVVTWSATSNTYLSSLVGLQTLPLQGTSQATASAAPKINFYLLVDTSPSMAIPATSAGIATMVANTGQTQDGSVGCAFACHEANPSMEYTDPLNNPSIAHTVDGTTCCVGKDNYAVARALGITLRIDLVNQAVSNLLSTAASSATTNLTTYGVSIATINYQFNPIFSTGNIAYTLPNPNGYTCDQQNSSNMSNLCAAQYAVSLHPNMQLLEVASNNYLLSSDYNNDEDSFLDLGLSTLGAINSGSYVSSNGCFFSTANPTGNYYVAQSQSTSIPSNPCSSGSSNPSSGPGFKMYTPGQGTNNSGDTPQEVLFIVTDGVDDEYMSSTSGIPSEYLYEGTRVMAPINTLIDNCTSIKSRGIRIAFLYLTYIPMTADYFYNQQVSAWQSQIQTKAQNCASPGLYQQVSSDQDISAALNSLFQTAVATAHLTQ